MSILYYDKKQQIVVLEMSVSVDVHRSIDKRKSIKSAQIFLVLIDDTVDETVRKTNLPNNTSNYQMPDFYWFPCIPI